MDAWDFQSPRGTLRHGGLVGVIDAEYPQRGMHELEIAGTPLPGLQVLGVEPPGLPAEEAETILEAYARGADLVATYAQSPTRSVRPQCYWRALECPTESGPVLGLELVFSMQTSLLESAPQASVVTRLPLGQTRRLVEVASGKFEDFTGGPATPENGSGLFLFAPAEAEWCVATMIVPSDFIAAELSPTEVNAAQSLRYQLFPHSLEKGVIRRARLMAAFLPASGAAEATALACYRQFLAAPLPLST